ncbi:hypothetical protein Tco_1012239 [Tanacetum coccineum]
MESIRSNVLQRWLILRIEDFVGSLGQCLAYQTERGLGGLKFLALNRALFFEWCGASFLGRWLFMRYSGFDFSSHCKKRIGDGSCTSFWYDIWLADAPLCVQFPRLFALELDKENCRVANKMELLYGPQLLFAGTLRDGAERAAVGDLSSIMKSVVLSTSMWNSVFKDDTKSQTGYVFVLNGGAVDWKSAKQSTTAMSSIEAEYIVAVEASMEVVWIRKSFYGLGGVVPSNGRPMEMLCDNKPAIAIANDLDNNVADLFTKPMLYDKHYEHAMAIGIVLARSLM